MPAFLLPILAKVAPWFTGLTAKLIAVAAILAAIGAAYWYVHHLQSEVATLTTTAADAKAAAAANAAQFADLKTKADQMAATISELEAAKAARQVVLTKARDQVAHAAAQPGGDAPVSPALKAALDAIRVKP